MKKGPVYLDNNATTPIDPQVLGVMTKVLKEIYGNPSSVYRLGKIARIYLDSSREKIASFFDCNPSNIIFTSGGTEANNLAIKGIALKFLSQGRTPHLITAKTEHLSVLNSFKSLSELGCEVTYIDVDKEGYVKKDSLKKAIKQNTVLISLMHSNNETGVIQSIEQIVPSINIYTNKSKFPKVYFHSDAVQTLGKMKDWVSMLYKIGVDMISVSAHKIYGPKGVGALVVKDDCELLPLLSGGNQEKWRRAGTENVTGIVGFAAAVDILQHRFDEDIKHIKRLEEMLIDLLESNKIKYYVNGDMENCLLGTLNVTFDGIYDGELLMATLDLENIYVSTGSACSSGAVEPSHVLRSMGLDDERVNGAIRISIGRFNTEEDIIYFVKKLREIVGRITKI